MSTIRPATPRLDDVLAQRTLGRYLELVPRTVHLAHYGAVDPPMEALVEAKERRFADEAAPVPDDPHAIGVWSC